MEDLGCGHPISMRVCRMGAIDLSVMKNPASSALAAEDMSNLMIWETVRTGPLSNRKLSYSYRNMYAPVQLQALISLRYAASECPQSTMSLAQKVMPSFGYVTT